MEFRINIHTDNAAFGDEPTHELARILRDVADRLAGGQDFAFFETLRDLNGNDVGSAAHKPDEYWRDSPR